MCCNGCNVKVSLLICAVLLWENTPNWETGETDDRQRKKPSYEVLIEYYTSKKGYYTM